MIKMLMKKFFDAISDGILKFTIEGDEIFCHYDGQKKKAGEVIHKK